MSTKKIVITRVLTPSSLLSHDVQDKLQTTGKLLDDLQEVQSARLSHRPEGPGGPTPEAAIRPSSQEKIIGKNPSVCKHRPAMRAEPTKRWFVSKKKQTRRA